MKPKTLKPYRLVWSPTGQTIGHVNAPNAKAARRAAPMPYRRFLGEIYAELTTTEPAKP